VYAYRYRDDNDRPLTVCPFCNGDLTAERGICLVISAGGRVQEWPTRLDGQGNLIDVDRLVENGYHSETKCGHCHESLVYQEDDYITPCNG
jgi:hypothetical protein